MMKRRRLAGVVAAMMVVAAMVVPAAASAFEGEYAEFNNCPVNNEEVIKCLHATTESGEVVLGSKKVPIVNPVILQGGYGFPEEPSNLAPFYGATNGVTLSKSPQPVPGGLAGLVNCKTITNFLLKAACELTLENGFTGVNSTVELARPAEEIKISEGDLLFEEGIALVLPVKFHLENPLLGSECYVGSSSNPVIWNLTTGGTTPPGPNTSIHGTRGKIEIKGPDEGILRLKGSKLVDNAWAAPGATGCGGSVFEALLNPIVNTSSGLPSPAGKNTAILIGVNDASPSEVVKEH
jgi:hypothetical protein